MEQTLAPFQHQELLLIGHSIGCLAIVKWYQRYGHSIKGALLVAPSDAEREGYPDYITGFAPIPLEVLPFPSIVVGSTNDHVTSAERSAFFAECWGSERIMLPQAGHIEPSSGYGDWPEGLALIRSLERGLN
jgi:predicted alpha/beta hydrolase family esterase